MFSPLNNSHNIYTTQFYQLTNKIKQSNAELDTCRVHPRVGSGRVGSSVIKSNKYAIYTPETDYSSTTIPNDKKL